ncbi:unnamed protein product [Fusarium graminearum]|jgi:hypothetical protein
MRG